MCAPQKLDRVAVLVSLILLLAVCLIWYRFYPLRRGEPLPEFRAQLVSYGWLPVRTDERMLDGRRKNTFGDARLIFQAGYIEVQTCQGTGPNACLFNYLKNGACLQITTVGEYIPPDSPILWLWTNKCPDPSILIDGSTARKRSKRDAGYAAVPVDLAPRRRRTTPPDGAER